MFLSKRAIPVTNTGPIMKSTASKEVQVDESELAPLPPKRQKFADDHIYFATRPVGKQRKIKILQQKVRRLVKKNKSMADMLKTLKSKALLTDDLYELLSNSFSGMTLDIFRDEFQNAAKTAKGRRYSQEVKQFALTLHYHSPKAYDYIREILHLPDPSSIRAWTASVNCQPGFLQQVFTYLNEAVAKNPLMADCVLVLDAMSIRKATVWDPQQRTFVGFVQYPGHVQLDSDDTLASEALVFMAVGLTGHWKHALGYFFVDHLSGAVQSQLVKDCLILMADHGLRVHGVVSDGTYANQTTARLLGVHLDPFNPKPYFDHPSMPGQRIFYMFDACHMLKLTRNMLAEMKVLQFEGNPIKWGFIEKLHRIQDNDSLTLGNRLTKHHIEWQRHKMNVKLAAQTLSSSVADAIDFLRDDMKLEEFRGSETTVNFIRTIDKLFDILNSRNPFAKGFKKPLQANNQHYWEDFLLSIPKYLQSIRDSNGNAVIGGRRKTAFLGFQMTALAVHAISVHLLTRPVYAFKYVLTYKMSQDHLELFFSKIRRRGGWNNNPNVQQFTWALRKVLLKNSITPSSKANCLNFEGDAAETAVFNFRWGRRVQSSNENPDCQPDQEVLVALQSLENEGTSEEIRDNILFYICGYICRTLQKSLSCPQCRLALSSNDASTVLASKLTSRKNRGGLLSPAEGVYKIVKTTERTFRYFAKYSV